MLALGAAAVAAGRSDAAAGRDWYELRRYEFAASEQVEAYRAYLASAALPALARLGLSEVGVWLPRDGVSPVWELVRHPSAESVLTLTERLASDAAFRQAGDSFFSGPKAAPPYVKVDSWLLRAFDGLPRLERPATGPERVIQLRLYESPSPGAGLAKIQMFNEAEIDIFRRVGLAPVFFGEALAGPGLPCLIYALAFESEAALRAAWQAFGADPGWQALRARPEYADGKIIRAIQNQMLRAAAESTI